MNICRHFFVAALMSMITETSSADTKQVWVALDRAERRTCPDISCGIVGEMFFRNEATILEERNGWGRISPYNDASCRDGVSGYVDAGNAACTAANGIVDGKFAEWVPMAKFVAVRPPDPAAGVTGIYALVKQSDDYHLYKDVFAKSAADLIKIRKCTEAHFKEMGGWYKSPKPGPIYFIHCGANKVELNALTGTFLP